MLNLEKDKLKKVVKKVVKKHGYSDETQIILSKGSGKGDGYLGEIVSIFISDEITKNTLSLIAKIALKDEKLRETYPYTEAFRNEILTYEKILPALLNLQIEANFPVVFNPTPKSYFTSSTMNEEYLLLEDLKISKFEMLRMRELLDHEHTKIICETYGKFHGLSFALKILHKEKFCELTSELKNVVLTMITEKKTGIFYSNLWNYIRKVMEERGIKSERSNNYADNSLVLLADLFRHEEDKYSCFLHGDSWTNNLMFRHKNNTDHKEVEEIKLIDWQACNVGPPVYDLSYTLYSGASKEILSNLETYLKIYHESLSKMLSQFNLDANSVYPFEEMKRQWKKYYHFGIISAGPIWKFRSFGENQGVDPLNFKSENGESYIDAIVDADCDRDYLYEHTKDLFDHVDQIDKGNILE